MRFWTLRVDSVDGCGVLTVCSAGFSLQCNGIYGDSEDVVETTRAFATTTRELAVRKSGSLQKVCDDVRRRTRLLGGSGGGLSRSLS